MANSLSGWSAFSRSAARLQVVSIPRSRMGQRQQASKRAMTLTRRPWGNQESEEEEASKVTKDKSMQEQVNNEDSQPREGQDPLTRTEL